jgi:2-haloacid dehalogenase
MISFSLRPPLPAAIVRDHPMDPRFAGIRACVFDGCGSLFDFAAAAASARDMLGGRAAPLTALWREKQLQYSWLRSLQGRYANHRQITADALDYALIKEGIADPLLRRQLLSLYDTLTPFPEVPAVLAQLAAEGYRLALLSNRSPDILASLTDRPGIREHLRDTISAEEVGAFKTAPAVYLRVLDRLDLTPPEICFISSNGWDAWAASDFGFRVLWCNRSGQPREFLPGNPDAELRDLAAALPLLTGR